MRENREKLVFVWRGRGIDHFRGERGVKRQKITFFVGNEVLNIAFKFFSTKQSRLKKLVKILNGKNFGSTFIVLNSKILRKVRKNLKQFKRSLSRFLKNYAKFLGNLCAFFTQIWENFLDKFPK